MTDVHAHFAGEGYVVPAELARMRRAGVTRVILASDTLAHAREHARISAEEGGVFFAAGIHPSESNEYNGDTVSALKALCGRAGCVAVGEIGLDYHYPDTDKPRQWEAFRGQILLADMVGLPIQIHSRDAAADTLAVLREMRPHLGHGMLLHCYSYGKELLDDFLRLGAYVSFGGVLCFKNARRAVESCVACPEERLLTETDSPYLSPFRGQKNAPANIPVVVARMAEIRGIDAEELAARTDENADRLFPGLRGER